MSEFRVGEIGRKFRYATNGFDMSASTGLSIIFKKPSGSTLIKTEASANPVTTPAIALVNDTYLGNQAASTYMEFSSVSSDFDEAGVWSACGVYVGLGLTLQGSLVTFPVLDACV